MKKTVLIFAAMVFCHAVFGQAKQPTLMVLPSDVWCNGNGYLMNFENQGKTVRVADYQSALQESADLVQVIAKINGMMAQRGFPLISLEQTLKDLETNRAEDEMTTGGSGSEMAESPLDQLRQRARADIWLYITWTVEQTGPKKSIRFILTAIDAFSLKQVAEVSGVGAPSFSVDVPVLLEEAVISRMDNFNVELQRHFDDLFTKGREIVLEIGVWKSFGGNLESEYNEKELSEIIEEWVYGNTKEHRFSIADATENKMLFNQVRIELYDARNRAQDARTWARGLQKYLRDTYKIDSKLTQRGLGRAGLIVGEK